jgi:hypothetical protein
MPTTKPGKSTKSAKPTTATAKKPPPRKKAEVSPWAQEVFEKIEALRKAMNGQKLA